MIYSKESNVMHEEWCPYVKRIHRKRSISDSHGKELGLCECKFCRSVKGIAYKYHIQPVIGMECFYDKIDDAVCFKTDAGFWKLVWMRDETWHLFHLNHSCFWKERPPEHMMRRSFHRQVDVLPTPSIGKIVNYIREHDKCLMQSSGDYRKMPRATKRQEHYYKKAKKKARKKSIQNVYKILDELNQNGSERRTSDG